jgi:hypothetical protein
MWYGIAADVVVAVHVTYVAYVIVGQLLIIAAAPMKWQWARNPWFRFTHLLAIVIVAVEAIQGWPCPLTVWEAQLRELAGQSFDGSESFMGKLLHNILFVDAPQVVLDTGYVATMILVVQGAIMYPPRWFRFGRRSDTPSATVPPPATVPPAARPTLNAPPS